MKITALFRSFVPAVSVVGVLLALASCGQKTIVSAEIDGLTDGNVIVTWYTPEMMIESQEDMNVDTLQAKGGRFTFDAPFDTGISVIIVPQELILKEPYGDYFTPRSAEMHLNLVQGEKVKVTGSIADGMFSYAVRGSGFEQKRAEARTLLLPMLKESDEAYMNMIRAYYDFEDVGDPALIEKYDAYSAQGKEAMSRISDVKKEYIKTHPDSEVSALYLLSIPREEFMEYRDMISEAAVNGRFSDDIAKRTENIEKYNRVSAAKEKIVAGADAPDFTLTDNNGERKSLRDFEADYIVLDFWGSWCGWCIKGIPQMKQYYEKYKGRLEIIGIACNDSEDAWRRAIADNQLPWVQLKNDDKADFEINPAQLYGVTGFPTKVIIDRDYKIVEVVVGESEEFYKTLDRIIFKAPTL